MKKEKGELSLHLTEPTPSRLKSECIIVYSERFKEKDTKALRLFFQTKEDTTDYSSSIRNIDTDKFKPLCNFLKGRTSDTDAKNIELLSWLIDFEPRPYDHKNRYDDLSGFAVEEPNKKEDIEEADDSKEIGPLSEPTGLEAREIESTGDYEENNVNDESETESLYKEAGFANSDSKNSGDSKDSEKINKSQFVDSEQYGSGDEIREGIDENNQGVVEQPPPPRESKSKKILITSAVGALVLFGGYFFLSKKSDVESTKVENTNQKQEEDIDSSEIQGDIKIVPKDTFLSRTSIERENRRDIGEPITKMADVPEAKCMYWNEDHYEKVFCNDENIIGKPIPINKDLVENFRKITFPDTITLKSEGKIWYSKSDGKFEYFTRPGMHPVNNKPLRKLSDYIIKTHILKN
ncbi:hypothetical protein [Chryseobacterium phocaeense]|uniref:hypothetical protein n=1 Tax=Chryseobacterium phocaeense TaxID=1816690 RepID=UPI0011192E79|nr:hypothetical protein [Chryseobacterium phocaeense]